MRYAELCLIDRLVVWWDAAAEESWIQSIMPQLDWTYPDGKGVSQRFAKSLTTDPSGARPHSTIYGRAHSMLRLLVRSRVLPALCLFASAKISTAVRSIHDERQVSSIVEIPARMPVTGHCPWDIHYCWTFGSWASR